MNKKLTISFFAALLVGSAVADDAIIGPKTTTCWTHSARMDDKYQNLPALYEICAKLGLDKEKCDSNGYFTVNGYSQIDKDLWYTGESSKPDDSYGAPRDCYRAVAVQHYYTWDGTRGTVYACMAPPEDDKVTPSELRAITRYAEHLNSIGKKTLGDHQAALYLKNFAKQVTR